MAVGDVISAISSIGTGSYWDFQPSPGVEVQIVGAYAGTSVHLYDGVTRTEGVAPHIGVDPGGVAERSLREVLITNARYLSLFNNTGATKVLYYYGIQTK